MLVRVPVLSEESAWSLTLFGIPIPGENQTWSVTLVIVLIHYENCLRSLMPSSVRVLDEERTCSLMLVRVPDEHHTWLLKSIGVLVSREDNIWFLTLVGASIPVPPLHHVFEKAS